jgi:hypothetical protein
MKSIALVALLALVAVRDGSAGVGLRWNGCSSPITNLNVEPYSATQHDLIVTLSGYEMDANEIDLTIAVYDPCFGEGEFIPQAWRFDAGGCQAGALTIDRPASFDGCDGLVPLAGPTFESVTAEEIHTTIGEQNFPVTYRVILIRIAQTFPTRHLVASDRYVVARIRLDMSHTVAGVDPSGEACGCGSAPRQITFVHGTIVGPQGGGPISNSGLIEDLAFWVDTDFCIIDKPAPPGTNGGADPLCMTTAARSSSWGAIKAQYR